ncbi:MAG: hypothetical protein IPK82_12295 [Polyangiaceae bacterium]|nr:hypothetical protein [Polyangiaceae bacterium]
MPTPQEIKKALLAAGFELYRTRGEVVHVAERVRENLLMDSGIFVHAGRGAVGFVVRAQHTDFPHETEDQLFGRARSLAASALERGYHEVEATTRPIYDPGDGDRKIDLWCEVLFERVAPDLSAALDEVRFALSFPKSAGHAD